MRTHELMRQSRERKGLDAAALAEKAGLREPLVHVIERGAFDELPSGLYGRSAVRAYAKAVGLNPDDILAEVSGQLRIPEDPLDGLVRVHGLRPRPKRVADLRGRHGTQMATDSTGRGLSRILTTMDSGRGLSRILTTMDSGRGCSLISASLEARDWRSAAASAIDGALLIFVSLVLIQLTAAAAGTRVADVLHAAAPALVLIVATVAIAYFVLLGGVRNATFGSTLMRVPDGGRSREHVDRIDASAAVRRAAECALRESSIIVQWLLATEQGQSCLRVLRMRRV